MTNRPSAECIGDIGWGRGSRNVRSTSPTSSQAAKTPARSIRSENPASPKKPKVLLSESDHGAEERLCQGRSLQEADLRAQRTPIGMSLRGVFPRPTAKT